MTGLLFPGQGAQFVGMGKDISERYDSAREVFQKATEVLGWDVAGISWNGPEEELVKTSRCQPALVTTSLAVIAAMKEAGIPLETKAAAGLSLGEYTALCYAGSMSLEDCLRVVDVRGKAMQECAQKHPGAMASIIGLSLEVVEEICAACGDEVVVANVNSPGQIAVSGTPEAVEAAAREAEEKGARKVVPLNVAGAFHSFLMKDAEAPLKAALAEAEIRPPEIPVISNVTAKPMPPDPDGIREILVKQLTGRVRWVDCVLTMKDMGIREFYEPGAGKVLTGLLRRIDRTMKCTPVNTCKDLEALKGEGR